VELAEIHHSAPRRRHLGQPAVREKSDPVALLNRKTKHGAVQSNTVPVHEVAPDDRVFDRHSDHRKIVERDVFQLEPLRPIDNPILGWNTSPSDEQVGNRLKLQRLGQPLRDKRSSRLRNRSELPPFPPTSPGIRGGSTTGAGGRNCTEPMRLRYAGIYG